MTMFHIHLKRFSMSTMGTRGVLMHGQRPLCLTLELPWKNNEPEVSCIPAGDYMCGGHSSARFKDVFAVYNVPDRSAILIHPGNVVADLRGCIAPGMCITSTGVGNSLVAMNLLRDYLPSPFLLTIEDLL